MNKPSKIGLYIARIHQTSDRIFLRKLKENNLADLNPSQGRVLFALRENDMISIQQLADRTSLSNSTLTVVLDKLENKDLIERVHSKEDRRKYLIKLKEKFFEAFDIYFGIVLEMSQIYYEGFSSEEIEELEKKLLIILDNLEKQEK
ncbi:MAG: MarR family transcriptional regulator [Candidatus Heimdallarchaeota archaeon]|nr:MarR family transcriptional regulator [Candidatus Heimdallarchaeota archaeon]MCK4954487.1 MarR family transcriptional regulator [Candidatus Heimdallarchaeota archaeon]